jgi:hypothetical protein
MPERPNPSLSAILRLRLARRMPTIARVIRRSATGGLQLSVQASDGEPSTSLSGAGASRLQASSGSFELTALGTNPSLSASSFSLFSSPFSQQVDEIRIPSGDRGAGKGAVRAGDAQASRDGAADRAASSNLAFGFHGSVCKTHGVWNNSSRSRKWAECLSISRVLPPRVLVCDR